MHNKYLITLMFERQATGTVVYIEFEFTREALNASGVPNKETLAVAPHLFTKIGLHGFRPFICPQTIIDGRKAVKEWEHDDRDQEAALLPKKESD